MRLNFRRILVPFILFAIINLDVAICPGVYPKRPQCDVSVYDYQNNQYVLVDSITLSRYDEYQVMFDASPVEGYTFIGFVDIDNVNEDTTIDNVHIYRVLSPQFTIYTSICIVPFYIKNENLEEFLQSDDAIVSINYYEYNPYSKNLVEKTIQARLFDKLNDILGEPNQYEGYQFMGYSRQKCLPENYTLEFAQQSLLDKEIIIDYTFKNYPNNMIYAIYSKVR